MAIWNGVGRKATETTAEVVKKAQNLAEVSKINNLILDEERNRDNIYRKIGMLYVSRQEGRKNPDFMPLLEELEHSEDTIRSYQNQLLSLKNAYRCTCGAVVSKDNFFCPACGRRAPRRASMPLNCPNCGHPVEKGNAYCTNCGKKIELKEKKCCPVCNEPIAVGSKFCTRCGTKVKDRGPAPTEAQGTAEAPSAAVLPEQQPMVPARVCAHCGAKIEDENAFCTECGTAWEDAENRTLSDKKTCLNCGAQIDWENAFCTECGTKLPV